MSFGHVRFTFMGFKGQICIGRGFHFSVHKRAATARSLAFPGFFHFTRILERVIFVFAPNQSWDMGLLEHKGGWDCTGWGNVHSNSHLSLFKPSPFFIAGICFFSVGFQIWDLHDVFQCRAERANLDCPVGFSFY